MKNTILLLILSSLAFGNQAFASEQLSAQEPQYQSLDMVHELVLNHVKQKIDQKIFEPTIKLRKLSPELKLPHCKSGVQLEDKRPDNYAGRMTISVHCLQPKWRAFIPVTVDGKQPAVIATKGILKRAVITSDDVKQVLISYKKIPTGSMLETSKVIGMRAKKSIAPNKIIKIRDLQPPYWVFKNKEVNILTRIGGIEVRTKGTALKSAVMDEQVPVKNSSSQKIIKGIVIAPNTVLVP